VSEPTPEENRQRAALAADTAVNALSAARNSLSFAADTAVEVDKALFRSEQEIDALRSYASHVRERRDEPWRSVRSALESGQDVEERLRQAQRGLGEVRDHLEQSARAIAAGREFLDDIERVPGYRSEATDQLRNRLAGLDRAVHGSIAGVERTGWRLTAAQQNLKPVLEVSLSEEQRERTAATIDEVSAGVTRDVAHARGGIEVLGDNFADDRADAWNVGKDTSDLATAIRAGTNPTPQSAQTAPGALSEDPRVAWSEGRDLGPGLDR